MEQLITSIVDWATSQGIGVAMLLAALFFLHNQNKKEAERVKAALGEAQEERNARLNRMEAEVISLTTRVNDCEKDRQSMWVKIVELAKNQQP